MIICEIGQLSETIIVSFEWMTYLIKPVWIAKLCIYKPCYCFWTFFFISKCDNFCLDLYSYVTYRELCVRVFCIKFHTINSC